MTRSLSSASGIALSPGGSEIGQTAQSIMSKYSTALKLHEFCGNLEPPYLSNVMCSSGLHHPSQAQLSYVWSMVRDHAWPKADSPVSEIRVAVNDWVNDLLVPRAEVSRLDEHLVKVHSSVFA